MSLSKTSSNDSSQLSGSAPSNSGIKINKNFLLMFPKGSTMVSKDTKDSCKMLHFSLKWNFEEILATIDGLSSMEYPKLLIFMIKLNLGFTAKHQPDFSEKLAQLQQKLLNFSRSRPIILQLTFCKDKVTKIFYKHESSNEFCGINKSDPFCNFLKLLESFSNNKSGETQILNALEEFTGRSLAIRFLQTMELSEEFFNQLVLNVAAGGTKAELLAALDAPFDAQGRTLSSKAQNIISKLIEDYHDPQKVSSVLLLAINKGNKEVIDYLITYWTHLIQKLPFDHQVQVSTAAFNSNQFNVLCDLLDIADFPFPKDFNVDSVNHDDLCLIIKDRVDFYNAMQVEDFEGLEKFIESHQSLKFVYNPSNNLVLTEAVNSKKFKVFYYLKSLGFEGKKCDDILNDFKDEDDQKQLTKLASEQRRKNINKSLLNVDNAVYKLYMQSCIHNRRISKEQEVEYRKIIMKWFTDIYNVAPEMLNVAASSDDLKIIFDFESFWVENASLKGSNASGSSFSTLNCIFIGSKLTDISGNLSMQRQQKIKGVLAHELCHYVMELVYENDENPYFENKSDVIELFTEIVNIIDKWSAGKNGPNDECNGIISTVYKLYKTEEFHLELIVRAVQILVTFDDNKEKLQNLQNIYEVLFNFWYHHVIPDLQRYISKDQRVVKLNGFTGYLRGILNSKIKVNPTKEIESLINNKLTIVTTNSSKLLFIDICKQLKEKFDVSMNSKNFFTDPEKLKNSQIWNEFELICMHNQQLSIFVDCSKSIPSSIGNIFINKSHNFTFVVSNKQQCQNLLQICEKNEMKSVTELDINYNWSNLTAETQNSLLKHKINFQNSQVLLKDLVKNEQDLLQVINNQLLIALIKNQKIFINTKSQIESNEKYFDFVFQERNFLQKKADKKTQNEQNKSEDSALPVKSQDELLKETNGQKYVLVSDQAGNGKSWTMKKLALALIQQNPTKWVTYVDLKQCIDEFKAHKGEPDFAEFMIESIIQPQQQFEANIFKKLYKEGKVIILFDGFDEIAPNYAKFVSKLAQDLQFNGGNQLWIATRNFFEVNLQQILRLDVTYSLKEMGEEKGIDMIVRSWVLMDLEKVKEEPESKESFDEFIKSLPEYKKYQQKADQLVKKAKISRRDSVGLPQLFKMIADAFKDEDNVDDLEGTKIYEKFLRALYIRWSDEKGQIRKEASIDSQRFKFNFYKFHQFHAISSLFPKSAKKLFRKYNGNEWQKAEIIACGILTIIDGKVYFVHETFREYFIADFIAEELEELEESEVDEEIIKMLVDVLTDEKFKMVRIFLNDLIKDSSSLMKLTDELKVNIDKFNEMKCFGEFFTKNLIKLIDLVLEVIKNGDYEKVKSILQNCSYSICTKTYNPKVFLKYQDFLIDFMEIEDLKDVITNGKLFHKIISSSLNGEVFEGFVTKVESKTDREFIKKALLLEGGGDAVGNIFWHLIQSSDLNHHKVQHSFKFIEKIFSRDGLIGLLSKCNYKQQNILQASAKPEFVKNLKILWIEIESYIGNEEFKSLLKLSDKFDHENILHSIASENDIELHETLWELLPKTFNDQEELKNFMFQKNKSGWSFLHSLVSCNSNAAVIELTFKNLKENFNQTQFEEIILSKFVCEMSLIQVATSCSGTIDVHKYLWKFFEDFCETKEKFLEMIKEEGKCGMSILHLAAMNRSEKIFEFVIQSVEKFATRDEIRKMLKNLSNCKRNLLQTAICAGMLNHGKDSNHEDFWKALRKYFDRSEMVWFIVNTDVNGDNLLFNAFTVTNCTHVAQELTYNNIKNTLTIQEQRRYLNVRNNRGDDIEQHRRRGFRISIDDTKRDEEFDLPFKFKTEFV